MAKRYKYTLVTLALLVGIIAVLTGLSYADGQAVSKVHAPEPTSLAFLSAGFFGWIVRFARRRFREFKRFFDVLVSIVGLIVALPIMALTALFIKVVSPGPAVFKQDRVGQGGTVFSIYKLRTMKLDAEKDTGPVWAQEEDPRLIRFGGLIRKLHLDELPQLFNVIKGEMSIVGPRPERPVFVDKLSSEICDYRKRLNVKPGITGLAQVWHKYDETIEDVKKKIKYDLLYIRKMCLMVDLRILLRTVRVSLSGKVVR